MKSWFMKSNEEGRKELDTTEQLNWTELNGWTMYKEELQMNNEYFKNAKKKNQVKYNTTLF